MHQLSDIALGFIPLGKHHHKRRAHRFFIHKSLIKPSMLTHIKSLVGSINYKCVFKQSFITQIVEHTAHISIERCHHFGIVAHVALELPLGERIACKISRSKFLYNGIIMCIPASYLSRIHSTQHMLISPTQSGVQSGEKNLIIVGQIHIMIARNGHFLRFCRRASGIIIVEICRQVKDLIFIKVKVASIGKPIAMHSLVMNQQAEWFIRVTLILHPIN